MKRGDIKYVVDLDGFDTTIYEAIILVIYDNNNVRAKYIKKMYDAKYHDWIGTSSTSAPEDIYNSFEDALEVVLNSPLGLEEKHMIKGTLK